MSETIEDTVKRLRAVCDRSSPGGHYGISSAHLESAINALIRADTEIECIKRRESDGVALFDQIVAELRAENATLRSEREKTEAALRKLVMALAESDDAADRETIVAMVALGLWQRDPKEAHDQS